MMDATERSAAVKRWAYDLGFMFCGISKARKLDEEAAHLEQWIKQGFQGSMHYLEKNADVRLDPRLLLPGAQSVISLAFNYFPSRTQNPDAPKIARYAYGKDYHKVLKKKAEQAVPIHATGIWWYPGKDVRGQCTYFGAKVG
jgi:epoxyqueuosine reductase